MADVLILAAGTAAAPASYEVPNAQIILPKAVHAVFDGTSASGSFLPVLEILSDAGIAVATCPLGSAIAAGGSAEVSWFPCAALSASVAAGLPVTETLYYDVRNASVTASTVLKAGTSYLVSVQGTFSIWNLDLDTGAPQPNALFPPSTTAGRVSLEVGLDAETLFAYPSSHPHVVGHSSSFQIDLGSGFAHVEPFGGSYATPQPDWFYSYTLVGQGSAPSFRLLDSPSADNYGLLKITIYGVPGGGGVTGLTAADTSIVVGGTAVAPTVRTNTLDVIAADHPPAADWSNNSHKITAVTDPTAAQDAATKNYVDTHVGAGTVSSVASAGGTITVTNGAGPNVNVDLPTTGVGAGAYGDSTHVGSFTVDADGRITAASQVAISGGYAGALLFSTTLGAAAASIDTSAANIAGYNVIEVYAYVRGSVAATVASLLVTVNNDAAAHYDNTGIAVTNTAVSGGTNVSANNWLTNVPGNTNPANVFGMLRMTIPFYDLVTTGWKIVEFASSVPDSNAASSRTQFRMGSWQDTAKITSVQIAISGGNLMAGTILYVIGH
jgi:hypothetical protein